MPEPDAIFMKDRKAWRAWLRKNHASASEAWLIVYRKKSGKESISYEDGVQEAVCWGWIDGKGRRLDDERYLQRYTPRTSKSSWSQSNIARAEKAIDEGCMAESGLRAYQDAMRNGRIVPSSADFEVPAELEAALKKNRGAWKNFQAFSPSAQLAFCYWVDTAKTPATRKKRVERLVELASQNKRLYDT